MGVEARKSGESRHLRLGHDMLPSSLKNLFSFGFKRENRFILYNFFVGGGCLVFA
jgi:hypothetical protein